MDREDINDGAFSKLDAREKDKIDTIVFQLMRYGVAWIQSCVELSPQGDRHLGGYVLRFLSQSTSERTNWRTIWGENLMRNVRTNTRKIYASKF